MKIENSQMPRLRLRGALYWCPKSPLGRARLPYVSDAKEERPTTGELPRFGAIM